MLAFYYGWYDATSKGFTKSLYHPVLGAYDSHAANVVAQHCRWAREAGITGFIVSWWGATIIRAACSVCCWRAQKSGISITAYVERVRPEEKPAPESAVKDVL